MSGNLLHETVLKEEAVTALNITTDGLIIDVTFGRGGHSTIILKQLGSEGRLIAIDRDPEAIDDALELQKKDSRLEVVHATFSQLEEVAVSKSVNGRVAGVLFDLGVSSPQLDSAGRGFSFMKEGPLDMRMNPMDGHSASQWINSASEKEISNVLFNFGEERFSRRIAKCIVREREVEPILTTKQLSDIVKHANPSWEKGKHPATRSFQAIRIFINQEFNEIEEGLSQALSVLKVGGRLVVISFHSLEDRIVKKFMSAQAKGDKFPKDLPVTLDMLNPRLNLIGKRIKASAHEIERNYRARSAVMRVAEKTA
ncbi:MAG: 16S rRNA (cytosine(1402)-N(4))-methyltransferase RsmH [Pseudomonadota bacterium]|nr:16S rRNA (cytosine(1402)-N(4))-methyltransferase RsmH [Pseudomonadota bacterium]